MLHLSRRPIYFGRRHVFSVNMYRFVSKFQGSSPLELSALNNEPNNGAVDTEVSLIASTDHFSLVSLHLHPLIMRSFKELLNRSNVSKEMAEARESSISVLRRLNKQLLNNSSSKKLNVAPSKIVNGRYFAEKNFHRIMQKTNNNTNKEDRDVDFEGMMIARKKNNTFDVDKFKDMVTCMTINQPHNITLWGTLDSEVGTIISQSKPGEPLPSAAFEAALLGSYAVHDCKHKTKMATLRINSSSQLIQRLLAGKDVFATLPTVDQASFVTMDNLTVRDNYAIEVLSLTLYLFAQHMRDDSKLLKRSKLMEELQQYVLKVLTSAHNPVKLSTLKEVWTNIHRVHLPDAYAVYKKLYQHVAFSLSTDSIQLVHQEESICTLFECMARAKFKDTALIEKIHSIFITTGFSSESVGVRLFNALIQLEAFAFASLVLETMMTKSHLRLESMPHMHRESAFNLTLTDTAKGYINNWLLYGSDIAQRRLADLILALFCFNREPPSSQYYRTLEQIEARMLPLLPTMSIQDVFTLMQCYADAGRYQPDIMRELDNWFLKQNMLKLIRRKQLETVMRTFARLNYHSRYIDVFIERYLSMISNIQANPSCRFFWSLAVLERLEPDMLNIASTKLYRELKKYYGESRRWTCTQLSQIECELLCKQKQLESARNLTREKKNEFDKALHDIHEYLEESGELYRKVHRPLSSEIPVSSFTHLDTSKILLSMGVSHENEKQLSHSYQVDMFIPVYKRPADNRVVSGIVIEFDGPFHYDSYLQRPMGPTLMKKRHLQSLGYHVITLSYFEYALKTEFSEKCRILREKLDSL